MNKSERIRAALRGEKTDRVPYGFWTHRPDIDLDADKIAEATAAFAQRLDLDFVKSMPNGFYCVEDWGCTLDFSDVARGGVGRVVRPTVSAPADWARLARLNVTQGALAREIRHLTKLVKLVGPEVPVLATVFSPLTIANKLSNGAHRAHIASHANEVAAGLNVITQTTCEFTRAAIAAGCAGIFFATQDATHQLFDAATYRRFGERYDTPVLHAAREAGGWFNVLHMHGEDILFDALRDYPVDALNWHIGETPPTIADYRASGGARCIVGGLQRGFITQRNLDAVMGDIQIAMNHTQGRSIILAPACVIRHPVDEQMLIDIGNRIKSL
ncbi:MAG: uroporphyrinogen decarboxylase [Betaproteobacteria bacterium]|nr:uroporphyrinogen decarboxylase [Betaproteobacteria bacterium]